MASGFTVVEYNGIMIYNCHTTQFNEKAVYDESETDLLYHEYEITVEGYLYPQPGNIFNTSAKIMPSAGGFGDSAAQHHIDVRAKLLQPRKEFKMTLGAQVAGLGGFAGGTVLLYAIGKNHPKADQSFQIDMDNGPKPQSVKVVRIAADEVIKIEFTIKIALEQCQGTGEEGNKRGVQSNRWTVVDEIDKNMYTTRTWTGVLEARGTSGVPNINVFRGWVTPRVSLGMRREKTSYEVDPTNTKLRYSITDREVLAAAPSPATDWQIRHVETINENGANAEARCTVEMVGPAPGHDDEDAVLKTTHRKIMLANAMSAVVETLVGHDRFKNFEGFSLRSLEFDLGYGSESENRVSVSMQIRKVSVSLKGNFTTSNMGRILNKENLTGYNPVVTNPNLENLEIGRPASSLNRFRGQIPLDIAFAAHLQDPCNDWHGNSNGNKGPTDAEVKGA